MEELGFGTVQIFTPDGFQFRDSSDGQNKILVTKGAYEGWICYQHPDGQWVTLRKATEEDKQKITRTFKAYTSVTYTLPEVKQLIKESLYVQAYKIADLIIANPGFSAEQYADRIRMLVNENE